MRNRSNRSSWPGLALALGLSFAAGAAPAAELNPYTLPSQQRFAAPPDARMLQQHAAQAAISNGYYERYARTVSSLSPAERSQLKATFSVRRTSALRAGRIDEADHYDRLVQILGAAR
jgi:hypothetical protein